MSGGYSWSLAYNLVGMHGGTIQAYSGGEGRGSTFTVNLPDSVMAEAVPAPVLVPIAAAAPAEAGPAASGGVRVLVVDDNQDAADSLAELLGALGYQASVAYDPARITHRTSCRRSSRPTAPCCWTAAHPRVRTASTLPWRTT